MWRKTVASVFLSWILFSLFYICLTEIKTKTYAKVVLNKCLTLKICSFILSFSVSVPANSGYRRLPDVSINDGPEEHGATTSSPPHHQGNFGLINLTHFSH